MSGEAESETVLDPIARRRAELAKRLAALSPEQRAKLAETPSTPAAAPRVVNKRTESGPAPMTFAQELLWRLERANPSFAYNVPRAVRLSGDVDANALERAINALVERHEALRTTFDLQNDEPVQIVHGAASVTLERIDVSHLPEADREKTARAHMREKTRTLFDLSRDSQLRAWLIRLAPNDHVLLLLSHHVSSDGWSGNIIMRELTTLYDAYRTNSAVSLPELPLQYGDYSTWQRRALSGDKLEGLLEFWRSQLEGAPALLDIPTDRARGSVPSFEGGIRAHALPVEVLEQLRALNKTQGTTTFMVLLATLYVLIYRYSVNEEIIIGTPIAGRPYPELEGVVGFFSNTLLLRASLAGNPTFAELLARVRSVALSAYDHQEMPLETLLTSRGSNGQPLATMPQFVLSTEDPDRERLKLGGTSGSAMREAFGSTKFDFLLSAAERSDGLKLAAEYRTELFDAPTIDRMLRHYGVLLESALANPNTRINELPLLLASEREMLLVEWNDTARAYPNATLATLLDEQVAKTPDAIALTFDGTTLSYREFHTRVIKLASALQALGVKPGVLVAVAAERSFELVVALHAVVRAGGAYVPLDPDYPADRLSYMLDDSAPQVLLTQRAIRASLPEFTGPSLELDAPEAWPVASEEIAVPAAPGDAAYMIYTSGSTGRPKGALNAHTGIVNRLLWMQEQYQLTASDIVLQKTPYSFDVSVWEFFWPLIVGARLAIANPGGHRDPEYLLDTIARERVTTLHFVPSMLRAFLANLSPANAPSTATLRHMMCSGEALPADLVAGVMTSMPQVGLHNLYGPTECAVDVSHWTCTAADAVVGANVPIGKPVSNTQLYVLDSGLQPVPVGVSGELYLAGVQVGLGYHRRPELTAERFVKDVFSANPDARMYRTGDRARWRADGAVEYLGRLDFQVKLRGHRIELGEIESTLLQHAAVTDAVAMVREDVPGDQRLVAYVVAAAQSAPTASDLREWVRRTLPDIMVPAAFVFLDRMPLTASGKNDRKALPVPQETTESRAYQGPRSTIEHELVQIWTRLLTPSRPISVFDDFFEIGGHSLFAIRMLADVERMRGQRVPLAWMFEASTIDALAARLSAQMFAEAEPPLVTLQSHGTETPIAFVHGDWTGGGWYARRLAPLVAPNAPFHVFPTIGGDDDSRPWTIESMAARHVGELKKVQPNGPYRVAGFCVGGVVAYEMARQLQDAGETVEHLVLVDSSPVNAQLRMIAPVLKLVPGSDATQRLDRQARLLRRLRWGHGRVAYFNALPKGTKSQWIVDKVVRTIPRMIGRKLGASPPISNVAQPVAVQTENVTASAEFDAADDVNRDALVLKTQARATSAYLPGRFRGRIDFLFAVGAPGFERRNNPIERWRMLADDVQLVSIESGHISLITNNLPLLADAMRRAFNSR